MPNDGEMLDQLISRRIPDGTEVGPAEIQTLLAELGLDDEETVLAAGRALHEWADGSPDLHFGPSGWRVQISGKAAQAALVSAILWGGLLACGVAIAIPATIATAVLPLIFDVDRIKLTRRDKAIFAHLVVRDRERVGTPDEWYDSLPADIRAELSRLDFLDILETIVASGHGKDENGEVTIFKSGDGRLAISIE